MARQHSAPILISDNGAESLRRLEMSSGSDQSISEADIQALVHAHPECLPIAEIDRAFVAPVPICRELATPAGYIDNFMVTTSGLPVLVECKLWQNPEGRREVVGQILDYAKELSRWSASDLQREVNRRLKREGSTILNIVRAVDPSVDEIAFNDALTVSLRRGRFLLLIVGDGIREGVEAIAEYLQTHAGLHFSFGLVELPFYLLPDNQRLVVPRIVAQTTMITRNVVNLPQGMALVDAPDTQSDQDERQHSKNTATQEAQQKFWAEFLTFLKLDDPEQIVPKPARQGYLAFMFPAPAGSSWLTVYRDLKANEVGVFLSSSRNSAGEYATRVIAEEWAEVSAELGLTAQLEGSEERPTVISKLSPGDLSDGAVRQVAFAWLAERTNAFVNVLRPRVRAAVADYAAATKAGV